jgi:hypothetical protein
MSGTKGRFRLMGYEQRELTGRASRPLCIIEQWSSIVAVSDQEYFIYYLFILLYPQAIVASPSCLTAPKSQFVLLSSVPDIIP